MVQSRIVGKKLLSAGFVYLRSKIENGKIYWECQKLRHGECRVRVITIDTLNGEIIFHKRAKDEDHTHFPNQEQCEAEEANYRMKRKADEHPERPPSAILRDELPTVSEGALNHLPDRENLKKIIRRRGRKNLPPNPRNINELGEVPELYQRTLLDEKFLIYDSIGNENLERELVFSIRRNLEELSESDIYTYTLL